MKNKKEKISKEIELAPLPVELTFKRHEFALPMIGWHDPYATITLESGEKWEIAIAGGCRAVWLTSPKKNKYSVSIEEIAAEMIKRIQKEEEK